MNVKNLKKIMTEKKTELSSLRNQVWRTVKAEAEKINELSTHIPTNNITELHELINSGAKLVCEKIGVTLKNTNRNPIPRWESRLET